jgi:acyl-CoA thioester hydrolase
VSAVSSSAPPRGGAASNRAVHRVRVGYVDTDKAGVVHHSAYLGWLEAARIEHLRARGLDYRAFEVETGLALPVVEAHLQYRAPARFDDEVDVLTSVERLTRARVFFRQEVRRGPQLLVEATIVLACVRMSEERVVSIPEAVARACS